MWRATRSRGGRRAPRAAARTSRRGARVRGAGFRRTARRIPRPIRPGRRRRPRGRPLRDQPRYLRWPSRSGPAPCRGLPACTGCRLRLARLRRERETPRARRAAGEDAAPLASRRRRALPRAWAAAVRRSWRALRRRAWPRSAGGSLRGAAGRGGRPSSSGSERASPPRRGRYAAESDAARGPRAGHRVGSGRTSRQTPVRRLRGRRAPAPCPAPSAAGPETRGRRWTAPCSRGRPDSASPAPPPARRPAPVS